MIFGALASTGGDEIRLEFRDRRPQLNLRISPRACEAANGRKGGFVLFAANSRTAFGARVAVVRNRSLSCSDHDQHHAKREYDDKLVEAFHLDVGQVAGSFGEFFCKGEQGEDEDRECERASGTYACIDGPSDGPTAWVELCPSRWYVRSGMTPLLFANENENKATDEPTCGEWD